MIEVQREDVVRLITAQPNRTDLFRQFCREEYVSLGGRPEDLDAALSEDVK